MRFRSRNQAMNMRKHLWACLNCPATYDSRQKTCDMCNGDIQYFASQSEYRRYKELLIEQRAGEIDQLECQPAYVVIINGVEVCTYKADFRYLRGKNEVIEDVKGSANPRYQDDVFKLKKKLVEAAYGVNIQVTT